jgi:hypothetical protein
LVNPGLIIGTTPALTTRFEVDIQGRFTHINADPLLSGLIHVSFASVQLILAHPPTSTLHNAGWLSLAIFRV